MTFKKALYLILPLVLVAVLYLILAYVSKATNPLDWPESLRLFFIFWSAVLALCGLLLAALINDKPLDSSLFEKHTHIPFDHGHITFYGKNRPSQAQLEVLEKLKDKVIDMNIDPKKYKAMITYEFFTPEYSAIIQNENITQALVDFKFRYGHTDIIAIVELERGQEFIGGSIFPKQNLSEIEKLMVEDNLAPPPPEKKLSISERGALWMGWIMKNNNKLDSLRRKPSDKPQKISV